MNQIGLFLRNMKEIVEKHGFIFVERRKVWSFSGKGHDPKRARGHHSFA